MPHPTPQGFSERERFGRYRILSKLGQGGMGSVYVAEDTQLDRRVALKVPSFSPRTEQEVIERFYREARAAATLQHPNICPVYDVGQINGVDYLTMALVEGRNLSDFIRPGKPLPERQVAAVVRKLALAMHEAHARGVIHRDLKPANIMIDQRQEPVIMDFGLALRAESEDSRLTQTGAILGTPAYMAPEQVLGDLEAIGPESDVYSLGVILYELLSGELPFDGPPASVLGQILAVEPGSPQEHRPDLDPRLSAVCLKAIAKRKEDRYRDMAELAAALYEIMHTPRLAPPPPVAIPAPPPPGPPMAGPDRAEDESELARLFANLAARAESQSRQRSRASRRRPMPPWAWIVSGLAAAAVLLLGLALTLRTEPGNARSEVPPSPSGRKPDPGHAAKAPEEEPASPVPPRPEAEPAQAEAEPAEPPGPPSPSESLLASNDGAGQEGTGHASPNQQPADNPDIERFRRAIAEGDPGLVAHIRDERLRDTALRDLVIKLNDPSLLAYIRTSTLRDTGFYRAAVEAEDPYLAEFIENRIIGRSAAAKIPKPKSGTVLLVETRPVAGEIYLDGNLVGAGYYAGPVQPGTHVVRFGAVRHPELAPGEFDPPQPQTVQIVPGRQARIAAEYHQRSGGSPQP